MTKIEDKASLRLRATYPLWASDKIRFKDLDRQDHVNNAVFATFFETGRVQYFRDSKLGLMALGETLVIGRIEIDFLTELRFPGTVDIGVRIASIGRSSFRMGEALFVGDRCAATGECVIVMMDTATRRAMPLTARVKEWLAEVQAMQPETP